MALNIQFFSLYFNCSLRMLFYCLIRRSIYSFVQNYPRPLGNSPREESKHLYIEKCTTYNYSKNKMFVQ